MEELKRLTKVVTELGSSPNSLLSLQDDSLLETKLFNMLAAGEVRTDEEAARRLYGSVKLTSGYRMLKSRFKKKLYNHLRFLDLTQKGYKQAHVAMYQCSTLLTEAFGLRALSELKLSVKVLEQALRVATEHEVVSMKVRILEEMKLLYFSLSDYKNYNRCSEQLRACYAVENCEREALLLYESVMLRARSGISERSHLFESLPGAVLRLEQLWQQSGSSLIFYYFNKLSILYLE